jgi:hypothetical protein
MLRISNRDFWNKPSVNSRKKRFVWQIFNPSGKPSRGGQAHNTVIPSLPRVRGSLLQRHPWTPWTYGILRFCNDRVNFTFDQI